jgi:hypothetical protein
MNSIDQRLALDTASGRMESSRRTRALRLSGWLALNVLAFGCATDSSSENADPAAGNNAGSGGNQANGSSAGDDDNAGDSNSNGGGDSDDDGGANNGAGTGGSIPSDCAGFDVLGLKYSPGGDVLPNKCKPFDTVTNNPHAIRCIDADPKYKTGFVGDDYCILPPAPENGFQVHIGPSDYANPEADYVLEPGEETDEHFVAVSGNDQDTHYFYRQYRMRPGSHHLILSATDGSSPGGAGGGFGIGKMLGVAQNPALDAPRLEDVPQENLNVGVPIAANTPLSVNLHYINTTDKNILQEAWVNVWYKPVAEIKEHVSQIFANGGVRMNIQPGEHVVLGENGKFSCPITTPGRILNLYGHRHASTLRFTAWRKRDGVRELIYEDYGWEHPLVLEYNSTTDNLPHNPQTMTGGGHSGVLDLQVGDALEWECEVDNQSGVPLRFVNEALTGEMCIVLGEVIGDRIGCMFE